MSMLTQQDLRFVVSRIPRDVREMMQRTGFILGGGFIRELVSGGECKDLDLFGSTKAQLTEELYCLRRAREADGNRCRIHSSDNADTLFTENRIPVQVIHRWLYPADELPSSGYRVVESFDFTVCAAAIWWDKELKQWRSAVHENFYSDLAAKRLTYTHPERNEDAGGSLVRVVKFLRRGYNIQMESLAGVIARFTMDMRVNTAMANDETGRTKVFLGLLREVDPLIAVDGIDPVGGKNDAE